MLVLRFDKPTTRVAVAAGGVCGSVQASHHRVPAHRREVVDVEAFAQQVRAHVCRHELGVEVGRDGELVVGEVEEGGEVLGGPVRVPRVREAGVGVAELVEEGVHHCFHGGEALRRRVLQ